MRVLGIDPGYAIVGWGVVEYAGNRFAPIAYGAVCTDKDTPFEQRLIEIYDGIKDICTRYQPEALSIEKLYYQHNQTTVIGVAEARGVILLAAAQCGHAGQAGCDRVWQGGKKADPGNDPHHAAPANHPQAGRYSGRPGHGCSALSLLPQPPDGHRPKIRAAGQITRRTAT